MLPKSLRDHWSSEALPDWVISEIAAPAGATYAALDASVWQTNTKYSDRLLDFLVWMTQTRDDSIRDVVAVNEPWPVTLDPVVVPWRRRTVNCLERTGFATRLRELRSIRFGDLFGIPAMGALSILDFCCTLEAAIEVHQSSRPTSGSTQTDAAAADVILRALEESWIDKVSDRDPRFAAMLPPGPGTLFERIDALTSVPGDSPGQVDERGLTVAIDSVRREIDRLESLSLDELLREYVGAVSGHTGERLEALLGRLGLHGGAPLTLQAAADMIGVTRERLRQLEMRTLERLPSHPVVMPALDRAIELLERSAPVDVEAFKAAIVATGIAKTAFHPRSVIEAAKLTGRSVGIQVRKVGTQELFVIQGYSDGASRTLSLARRQAGASGLSSVFEVLAELQSAGTAETIEEVRATLRLHPDIEFLGDDWFWHAAGIPERNRLRNVARKILSVASPVEVGVLRDGVRRHFKYRRSRGISTWPLTVAPRAILEKFFEAHPEFTIESGLVAHISTLDYRTELSPSEQVMASVLRSSPTGLLDRASFERACIDRGVTRETFGVFTSYGAFIEHLGTDLWTLRGLKVDPTAVEALRQANAERPREKRIVDHGWSADGSLWLAVRLPSDAGVVGIPATLRHALSARDFVAKNESGATCGTIRIDKDGTSWGYAPFLRRAGADDGDILLATFDLVAGTAQLEITDDEGLEDLAPA